MGGYFIIQIKEYFMILDYMTGQGDYYNDIDDLLKDDPTIEVDIQARGMKKRMRIRALSFVQMEKIAKASTDAEGKVDNIEFVLHTLCEGVVRPKFNSAQAKKLMDAHGETVKEIAENIWQLGRISKQAFDEYITALQTLNETPAAE